MNIKKWSLNIGWLYPELMSTYGDRGNIIVLQKRCSWRGIKTDVKKLDLGFKTDDLKVCDLLFMGGAQDKQQQIVADDLFKKKGALKEMIDSGIPGLYICGAYQFLGKYYREADKTVINGLGILDLYTQNPGIGFPRLIGNVASRVLDNEIMVGFENHGGRTYLGNPPSPKASEGQETKPFGKVIKGFGNNGEDQTEGAIYKNSFCSYFHGPILPKNPKFADLLIKLALEKKYDSPIEMSPIENSLEQKAREDIFQKLNIRQRQ